MLEAIKYARNPCLLSFLFKVLNKKKKKLYKQLSVLLLMLQLTVLQWMIVKYQLKQNTASPPPPPRKLRYYSHRKKAIFLVHCLPFPMENFFFKATYVLLPAAMRV